MAGAPQGGGGQSDNSAGILWGVAALFAAIAVIWYVFQKQIVVVFLTLKLYEVNFLMHLSSNPVLQQLQNTLERAIQSPSGIKFSELLLLGGMVGDWFRWPIALIFLGLGIMLYFWNVTRMFKNIYSMRDLAKHERPNWPQITPVINLDLIKDDIRKGPWAMGMTPMQFCKHHRLIMEVRTQRTEGMSRKDRDRIEAVLLKGEANKLFALQLGVMFRGVEALPPHVRALFAAFAARVNADPKGAEALLRSIADSSSGKLNFSGTDALLKKHIGTKLVQEIMNGHAYVYTVMASMLEGAREDGVQASADFLWLKPYDRRLWYVLNSIGRQTPFAEVAGIFAHWLAEKEAGRKLVVPMVEEATKALEVALLDVVYRPDEEA